jgi:tetratricopeptide (TPR) repeat protein
MYRIRFFGLASAALLMMAFAVSAQTGFVRGTVKLQQVDGTQVPVEGVLVEAYRTDIDKGKMPSTKTNKRGEFNFAGFMLGHMYALSFSGPGIAPAFRQSVKAGMEDIVIVLSPGDGTQWTEEQVRKAVALIASGDTTGLTAEQKKAQEEYLKEVERVTAANKKAEDINKIVNASLKDGDAAYKVKNYEVAITKFDEGINADPDFEGSAPILLNYKGVVLKDRGFAAYERAVRGDPTAKDAEMAKAKADWTVAVDAFNKGLAILKAHPATDPKIKEGLDQSRRNLLSNAVEVYRLLVKTKADPTKASEATAIYQEYFTVETDAARKLKAQLTLADMLREAGDSEPAVATYRTVLESSPDNPDALAGIGLSLFNLGVVAENKEQMQEGLNYMTKFADTAPDTHPLKSSVKEAVEYLKTEQKLAPQKTPATRRKN